MRVLITGICGFIGHHFCEHILKNTDWEIVGVDSLTYASSGFDRLRDIEAYDDKRVTLFSANIHNPIESYLANEIGNVDYIVHMAAETHVDNSIDNPHPFIMTNVVGTYNILEFAKTLPKLKMMLYFSTDEVFGPAPEGVNYREWDRYNSTNPYSASKAGGEELCLAYANCYGMNVCISHTMNVMGQRQHPEKYIPLCVNKILAGETISIHSNAERTEAGKRHYIHARNVADATLFLLKNGERREKYNVVGELEVDNLTLAYMIAEVLDKPLNYEFTNFHESRPGHDLRYALDGTKMKELGWQPPKTFKESLRETIEWYFRDGNDKWLKI